MMTARTYAHIVDGTVREIFATEGDIAEMFHADLVWIEVTDLSPQPVQGWRYDGKAFTAPPTPAWTPSIRTATSYDLVKILTDDEVAALGKAKAKDQHLFGKRDGAWPEDNPKIARFATALATTPKAWFDRVFATAT